MKTPSVYVPGPVCYPRILAYHEVSSRFQLGVTGTTLKRFQSHIDFLLESGLEFTPLRGLSEQSPENCVCLTFDDGYSSFIDEVLPVLKQRKIPATLFIITGYVGQTNRWDVTFGLNRRRHLNWEQIRHLHDSGIEIGSHTTTHRDLTRIPIEEVQRELSDSRRTLEDYIGAAVTSLAMPFGAANLEIAATARNAGYLEICGSVPGLRGPLPGVLARMPVYRWDTKSALQRKLDRNIIELLRLSCLHACSHGTRVIKSRKCY